jgi:hypothetical protein
VQAALAPAPAQAVAVATDGALESLRTQLDESRRASAAALEVRLLDSVRAVLPVLERARNAVAKAAAHKGLAHGCGSLCEGTSAETCQALSAVFDTFKWLDLSLQETASVRAFLRAIDHITVAPGLAREARPGANQPELEREPESKEHKFLADLARTLGDILAVSVPIVARPHTLDAGELHFRRRLLSRHLSQAKIILTASMGDQMQR